MPDPKTPIAVIGCALDLGSGRRGVDMGPSAIRYGGLNDALTALGHPLEDRGNVVAPTLERLQQGDPAARYWDAISDTCERLSVEVADAVGRGQFPLVLGGDHSISIGTLGGLAQAHGASGGVIWIDAHADINTPASSPSGNVHGMPLAIALGLVDEPRFHVDSWPRPTVAPHRTVIIGARSVDAGERELVRRAGVTVYTMSDIDRLGMHQVMETALRIASGGAFLHVSFDLDVVDPEHAPGVGTPVRGGITFREAHLAMELLFTQGGMDSLELVEVNPILDIGNTTGDLAVDLARSALGARIL
ncbi:MAG: arginase [Gaiellales bacterium]